MKFLFSIYVIVIFNLLYNSQSSYNELLYQRDNNNNLVIVSLATNELVATGIIQLKNSIPDDIVLIVMVPYSMTENNIKWHQRLSLMNNTHIHYISEHVIDEAPIITSSDVYLHEKGFRNTWYKLAIWSLTSYYNTKLSKHVDIDRIVFLDADTMITGNITSILHYFSKIEPTAMAYDTIPPGWFNTGVIVTEPSTERFKLILSQISNTGSVDKSDQGFLNILYNNHPEIVPWKTHLNFSYNAFSWVKHIEKSVWNYFEPIQIIHFNTLTDKPYGESAIKERDLNKNTPFIKSHVELIELWKIWRRNYCNQIKKMNNSLSFVEDVLNYC